MGLTGAARQARRPALRPGGTAGPGVIGFIPNPKAPEEQVAEYHGDVFPFNDGTHGPIAKGLQPITSTNPNGYYAGVSPMSAGILDMWAGPDSHGGGNADPSGNGN